jgi:hypothetical protein
MTDLRARRTPSAAADRWLLTLDAMSSYSVHLLARGEASQEALDALMDAVHAVISGGPGHPTWSVTLNAEADSPMAAASQGAAVVSQAAASCGLSVHEFIRAEAGLTEYELAHFPFK